MAVPGSGSPLLFSADAGAGGFAIERSLRFNSADSAYLYRDFSTSNRQTWTWSGWVKRAKLGTQTAVFMSSDNPVSNTEGIRFFDDKIELFIYAGGYFNLRSADVFRDPSAWYHFVVVADLSNATQADRMRLYANGRRIDTFSVNSIPSNTSTQFSYINNSQRVFLTRSDISGGYYGDHYLADIHFIDGQALDPTSFGEFDATTGVWNPIEYTGSYGTNGFHLDFADNSSAAALGYDAAGSNDWTVNNLSVTAGAGNDSLRDSPTNGDPANDTGAGGEVPGNYCTWNPLRSNTANPSNGNLQTQIDDDGTRCIAGTISVTSGKWYWEITCISGNNAAIGVSNSAAALSTIGFAGGGSWIYYQNGGGIYTPGYTSYGTGWTVGDVIGVALDMDSGTLTFYKNGSSQGVAVNSGLTGKSIEPLITNGGGSPNVNAANFGQRAFAYTAPSGFKALCTANLDTPTIEDPSTVMDVALYTGNAPSTQTITGLGFSPDMVWIKNRSVTGNHIINDIVRGAGQRLITNLTNSEATDTDRFSAFTSDGFTVGDSTDTNGSSNAIVAWAWDAGTSNATNTSGSITSTVRANISAGFSVVTYNAGPLPAATGATVGHGLGIAPQFIVVKDRTNANPWGIYHTSLGPGKGLLFSTAAEQVASTWWNNTAPTSSVFSINSDIYATAQPNDDYVAYCFAPVAGYSAFGSYTGNGSTDGPFVYTGMRPRWIMTKASSRLSAWYIHDTARGTYNVIGPVLAANTSAAEITPTRLDILSNGFKIRDNDSEYNASGDTYVWAAFAEHPFAYARAR